MKIIKLFKRWKDMLSGKSVFHVKQGVGKYYSKTEVKGYYNDLTGKVCNKTVLDENGIPLTETITGKISNFPIAVFQYALGLYDNILEKNNETAKKEFINIANWALAKIKDNGMWDCMSDLNDSKHESQSAMCQSEGASVLIRAYVITNDKKFLNYAKKAIDFMITPVDEGGTCFYDLNGGVIFQEYVSRYNLSVLNGWIFSIFGLIDITKVTNEQKYKDILNKTIKTLSNNIKKYDRGFWSNYDIKGTIASPAYHDVHIMQLNLLYELFGEENFKVFSNKWSKYQASKIRKFASMLIKLLQKLFIKKYYDINTSTVEIKK